MAPTTQAVILYRLVGLSLVAAVLALAPPLMRARQISRGSLVLYDNADFDEVILLITSNLGAIQPSLVWSPRVVVLVVGRVSPADTVPPVLSPPSSGPSRAPPLA